MKVYDIDNDVSLCQHMAKTTDQPVCRHGCHVYTDTVTCRGESGPDTPSRMCISSSMRTHHRCGDHERPATPTTRHSARRCSRFRSANIAHRDPWPVVAAGMRAQGTSQPRRALSTKNRRQYRCHCAAHGPALATRACTLDLGCHDLTLFERISVRGTPASDQGQSYKLSK